LRSLTRNQSIGFTLALVLGMGGVAVTVLAWIYPDFWKTSTPSDRHTDLRPYVTVKQIDLLGEFADGKAVQGQVTLINSGRIPATDLIGCATLVFRPNSRPMTDGAACPETDIPGPPPRGEYSHLVLGPGLPVTIGTQTFSINPATQALGLMEAGAASLYVYGDASYADTILPGIRHHLKFCGSYGPRSKSFTTCEKHNSMD
jgi:hypothetical protein